MSGTAALWLAVILIAGGGVAGVLTLLRRDAKKAGQKEAEAFQEQSNAVNAKAASEVLAEHRNASDAVKRLRDGTF